MYADDILKHFNGKAGGEGVHLNKTGVLNTLSVKKQPGVKCKVVSTLQTLLTNELLANGVDRQAKMVSVRNYINTTDQNRIKRELAGITSIQLLIQMQAVGVPSWLSDTFFTVWALLQAQRGGA